MSHASAVKKKKALPTFTSELHEYKIGEFRFKQPHIHLEARDIEAENIRIIEGNTGPVSTKGYSIDIPLTPSGIAEMSLRAPSTLIKNVYANAEQKAELKREYKEAKKEARALDRKEFLDAISAPFKKFKEKIIEHRNSERGWMKPSDPAYESDRSVLKHGREIPFEDKDVSIKSDVQFGQ